MKAVTAKPVAGSSWPSPTDRRAMSRSSVKPSVSAIVRRISTSMRMLPEREAAAAAVPVGWPVAHEVHKVEPGIDAREERRLPVECEVAGLRQEPPVRQQRGEFARERELTRPGQKVQVPPHERRLAGDREQPGARHELPVGPERRSL